MEENYSKEWSSMTFILGKRLQNRIKFKRVNLSHLNARTFIKHELLLIYYRFTVLCKFKFYNTI